MFEIIFPLSITLAIETPIYLLLKWRDLKLFIVISILNLVLNPTMNIILGYMPNHTAYYATLISYEIMTTLVESLVIFLFMRFKYWKVLLFAMIANGASFLMGYLLRPVYQTKITIVVLTVIFLLVFLFFEVLTLLSYMKRDRDSDNNQSDTNGHNA